MSGSLKRFLVSTLRASRFSVAGNRLRGAARSRGGLRKHPGMIRRNDDADLVLRIEARDGAQLDRFEAMAERLDRVGRLRAVEMSLDHAAGETVHRAHRIAIRTQ